MNIFKCFDEELCRCIFIVGGFLLPELHVERALSEHRSGENEAEHSEYYGLEHDHRAAHRVCEVFHFCYKDWFLEYLFAKVTLFL